MTSYLYARIKEDIRKRIQEGEWSDEVRLPSSRDFAQAYRSSVNTVEKAVKELCVEGCLRRDNRRGTFISSNVVSSRSDRRNGLVAASVFGTENPLWATALRGIEDMLRHRGYHLMSFSDDRSLAKLESFVTSTDTMRMDGIILSPIFDRQRDGRSRRLYDSLAASGIKIVFLDRHEYDSDIPFVTSDNIAGAYKLARLLLDQGHRRILFLRNGDMSTFHERLLGVKQAYLDAGIGFEPDLDALVPTEFENFEEELDAYADRIGAVIDAARCTAVFAANDQIAEAVIAAFARRGIRVPDDISLVTYDALNLNRRLQLDVTGANQPFYEMGKTAASLLMNLLHGKEHLSAPSHICKAEIHYGNSVGPRNEADIGWD
ncbi:GntR family transcriptional regulator [Cohnella terricola]|uniref:Substrate-binding domain-containing protein n=1 Tax=Cohnella terricola TaxID=1289167 RepID=A0A559J4W1_9BACL|nr:GntR family transcriptional regulator [Cohnella terricola]TVX94920.1 substrate-binding domain-containing protein [Cohnella terricola]